MNKHESKQTYKLRKLLKKETSKPIRCDDSGTTVWRNEDGRIHRDFGPAIIKDDGEFHYYKRGERHNEEGPAVIKADGTKEYFIDGYSYSEAEFMEALERAKLTDEEFDRLFFGYVSRTK